MKKPEIRISTAAALILAVLYYVSDTEIFMAFFAPIAVHELGHVLTMFLLNVRIYSIRLQMKGLCIDYFGNIGALGHALIAVTGPAAGFAYAWSASAAGNMFESPWLCLSAGISLLLSLFNLIPALPLDGGRIFLHLSSAFLGEYRSERFIDTLSCITGAALLATGLWLMLNGHGPALTAAAVWILLYQDKGEGLVKKPEVL